MLKYVLAASLVFNALLGINTGAVFACGTRHIEVSATSVITTFDRNLPWCR